MSTDEIPERVISEGRRAYQPHDLPLLPKRRYFDSEQAAHDAMKGNEVAYRIGGCTVPGVHSISILGSYLTVIREKKGKPYRESGRHCLASCQADAEDQLSEGTETEKTISDDEWIAIQARQHLRAIGIKTPKRSEAPSWAHLAKTNVS